MSNINFSHSQDNLKKLANHILERATSIGASSAGIEINENIETGVEVLNGNIENFETSYDSAISLSVYIGHKCGNVSISQVPPQDIDLIINSALDIAKYTQDDPYQGIAEPEFLCKSLNDNLDLYNPLDFTNQELVSKTLELETIALNMNSKITASNGAAINLGKYNFVIASTNGLNLGYQTTRYNNSISLIGNTENGMQTDYWYSGGRAYSDLENNNSLATRAVHRVLRRLTVGQIKPGNYPVIFEAPIAKSLIGGFLGAISGNNLYRNLSFLNNSINTQVFPSWLNITEDPFRIRGQSSCYFDNEGVSVTKRNLVENGIVKGYILTSYSARKLGMQTTGNSGGNHNISISNNFSGDVSLLAKKMHKGLVIIETIGYGVNMVTGDYSVGASGLWVENGEVQFFVNNLTISGNLKEIYAGIQYISDDYTNSSILCGSILVDKISISTSED
jgi:PmbA protein